MTAATRFPLRFLPEFVTVEREAAVLEEVPAPGVLPEPSLPDRCPFGRAATIARMAGAPTPTRIEIPRWVQLVGLPLVLLLVWVVAGALRHVVFLFLVAALIALLLNPIVRGLGKAWIPRGLAVAIVYLAFAAVLALAVLALATVVVKQTRIGIPQGRQLLYGRPPDALRRPARSATSPASSSGSTPTT